MRHFPPPYLPAADLGLTDDELHALLWVTERLEDGRIGTKDFTMRRCERFDPPGCKSPCCIGGHMGVVLGDLRYMSGEHWALSGGNIAELLFPPDPVDQRHPAWDATPPQAARACRQFLQTGAVDWDAVIDGRV